MLRSVQGFAVALVLGVLGCHRGTSDDFTCGTAFEPDEGMSFPTLVGSTSSGPAPTPIDDAELLAILSDASFDRCGDEPRLRHRNFTDEQKFELAKVLMMRAIDLEGSDDHACRLALLEQAYYLVPSKHGLALWVGEAAFAVGDCEKASMFLRHYLYYADPQMYLEKRARAQEIVARIETVGCGQSP